MSTTWRMVFISTVGSAFHQYMVIYRLRAAGVGRVQARSRRAPAATGRRGVRPPLGRLARARRDGQAVLDNLGGADGGGCGRGFATGQVGAAHRRGRQRAASGASMTATKVRMTASRSRRHEVECTTRGSPGSVARPPTPPPSDPRRRRPAGTRRWPRMGRLAPVCRPTAPARTPRPGRVRRRRSPACPGGSRGHAVAVPAPTAIAATCASVTSML